MTSEYPMLRLIERYGAWMAIAAGLLPLAAALWALAVGESPWWLLAGIIAAIIAFAAVRSYVELVRVMTDMLLPK
jgi:hypothetical protein